MGAEPRWHGLLLIDKPGGITSHDVVARVRRASGQKRVGHTGTLDPLATGLMAVLLGQATRLEPYLTKMDKVYFGRVELGLRTETDDITGRILERRPGPWPTEEAVTRALAALAGAPEQIPPVFSAVKVDGRRAYKAARAGAPPVMTPRQVKAYRLELLAYQPPFLDCRAEVSSGYYIRSLARDLGAALGLGGVLTALRRIRVGPWTLEQARSLDDLAAWSDHDWANGIFSPAEALPHLPSVTLEEPVWRKFRRGQPVAVAGPSADGPHKILTPEGRLGGLGDFIWPSSLGGGQPSGPFLRPLRVFTLGVDDPDRLIYNPAQVEPPKHPDGKE